MCITVQFYFIQKLLVKSNKQLHCKNNFFNACIPIQYKTNVLYQSLVITLIICFASAGHGWA